MKRDYIWEEIIHVRKTFQLNDIVEMKTASLWKKPLALSGWNGYPINVLLFPQRINAEKRICPKDEKVVGHEESK